MKMVQEIIEKVKEEAEGSKGSYLPLSVWEKQGFDPKLIQQRSTEKTREWNESLGVMTYQVKIHETRVEDIKRRISRTEVGDFARRTMARRSSSPRPPTEATGKGGATAGESKQDKPKEEGEEAATSTPKKWPKASGKPKPKEVEPKAKGPSDAVLRKTAASAVSMTTTALISVTADLADSLCDKVHPNIKQQAEDAKKELQIMQKSAEAALKAKDISGKGWHFTPKEVAAQMKPHIDACSLLSTILTALRQDARRKLVSSLEA